MLNTQQATYIKKVMGDHSLTFSFESSTVQTYKVGDTLTYKNEELVIRTPPLVIKQSSQSYQYTIVYEGMRYQLNDMPIMHLGDITFSYLGTAEQFLLLITDSMRTINNAWIAGFSEETLEKWIDFDNETCLSALEKVCEMFSLEYDVIGHVIELRVKVGVDTNLSLEYGRGKGLYQLQRSPIQNEGIFTRVLAFGSEKNLPESYAGKRLRLDIPLENNASLYGLKVTTYIDDEIYPSFTGVVQSIKESGLRFIDDTIDFDIKAHLLEGVVGKVVFQSGELTGKQFEINFIGGDEIGIKSIVESDDYKYPNDTFKIKVGDTYTLVDIKMPNSYIDAALVKLEAKANEYLSKVSIPQVTYMCQIDVLHLKRLGIVLGAGDYVTIQDTALGINKKIRIQSVQYPASYPEILESGMQFNCEISDVVTYSTLGKINEVVKENEAEIRDVNYESKEASRNNIMAIREFRNMVFDPDGNMATPLLEAMSGIFGTESQYFDLIGITINVSGDTISITEGQLVHYALEGAAGNTWEVESYVNNSLVTLDSYYISARCSKTTNQGNWVVSQTPIKTEEVPGYYHFNLGVLSSNGDGNRIFKATKMFTTIDGGNIDTNTLIADIIRTRDLTATNLKVTGRSEIAGFNIEDNGLVSDDNINAYVKTSSGDGSQLAQIGIVQSDPVDRQSLVALFLNNKTGSRVNRALALEAKNGDDNVALDISHGAISIGGGVRVPNNKLDAGAVDSYLSKEDFIFIKGGTNGNVFLLQNPLNEYVIIKNVRNSQVVIKGNGTQIILDNQALDEVPLFSGECMHLVHNSFTNFWIKVN